MESNTELEKRVIVEGLLANNPVFSERSNTYIILFSSLLTKLSLDDLRKLLRFEQAKADYQKEMERIQSEAVA